MPIRPIVALKTPVNQCDCDRCPDNSHFSRCQKASAIKLRSGKKVCEECALVQSGAFNLTKERNG